jgi:hypothetical protein
LLKEGMGGVNEPKAAPLQEDSCLDAVHKFRKEFVHRGREVAVNEAQTDLPLNESEIFSYDVPDEVLEAAACSGSAGVLALTIAMCTGNAECPF